MICVAIDDLARHGCMVYVWARCAFCYTWYTIVVYAFMYRAIVAAVGSYTCIPGIRAEVSTYAHVHGSRDHHVLTHTHVLARTDVCPCIVYGVKFIVRRRFLSDCSMLCSTTSNSTQWSCSQTSHVHDMALLRSQQFLNIDGMHAANASHVCKHSVWSVC